MAESTTGTKTNIEKHLRSYFPFGLQLSRRAWDWLELRDVLSELEEDDRKRPESYRVRRLAARYNDKVAQSRHLDKKIKPAELITAGTIVELLRYLVMVYCYRQKRGILRDGIEWALKNKGEVVVEKPPPEFVKLYPSLKMIKGDQKEPEFLRGSDSFGSHKEAVAIEMILLSLNAANRAFKPFTEFYDDSDLRRAAPYPVFVRALEEYFESQPPVEGVGVSLYRALRAPMEDSPDSLDGQLDYIRRNWESILPQELMQRILQTRDTLHEEWLERGFGEPLLDVMDFRAQYDYPEPEAFSRDADWMSNVVLIAKTAYVWLDQLSKKYQRHIRYLSDVPDEELDRLARWHFTGLWLIGIWERSSASRKIKQKMGNPDAMSSAYSLYDYVIANDLGGEQAYENLRERCRQRGIRLAADMVPNHVGIYSKWVIEHPDWFIQTSYPPFPVYQYNGENLSEDGRVVLQIEDGYWEQRDAAVVFKRIDTHSGDTRYIYHGNDGTHMPWNDTAQLDFLNAEVREAVIQTILHVARKFSIIRFDAAMTLAKKHFQRLWFPPPGDGGAIPSRAEHGMTREEFDKAMPREFWREVVDRIQQEVPDTLLLAEAFWLMEGYFVRTLGMHRVYNSAFMNMLKMEENSKYRQTVKNVLEFSPEVIKRFVNFMNNPDEKTAVEQFGKGDKYFGIAMMMVTMPGLPMFGHGQIEGFAEKYGMEYPRAYWDERIDEEMVHRHEREIFPLMQRRSLFSGSSNFAFFDFITPEGWVDENVFAYTNRSGDERALILYNNAYNTTRGTISRSTAINTGPSDQQNFVHRSVTEALGLRIEPGYFYIFRDHRSSREYIRSGQQLAEHGFFAELNGYQYHAFLDFREVFDHDGAWREFADRQQGAPVVSVEDAYREWRYEPVLTPFRKVVSQARLEQFDPASDKQRKSLFKDITSFFRVLVGSDYDEQRVEKVSAILKRYIENLSEVGGNLRSKKNEKASKSAVRHNAVPNYLWPGFLALLGVELLEKDFKQVREEESTEPENLQNTWMLPRVLARQLGQLHADSDRGFQESHLTQLLLDNRELLLRAEKDFNRKLLLLFRSTEARDYLDINRYQNVLWFNKEKWEQLILYLADVARVTGPEVSSKPKKRNSLIVSRKRMLIREAEVSGYKLEDFVEQMIVAESRE